MPVKKIDIMFPSMATDEEKDQLLKKEVEKIEKRGGKIVGGEPIEEINVRIIGKTYYVEEKA